MPDITIRSERTLHIPEYGAHLDMSEIQRLMRDAGSHFFDADTMRWFRSRVDWRTYAGPDGWYFVTSEQHKHTHGTEPRLYTVRRMSIAKADDGNDDLRLYELEKFQYFPTLRRARTAAAKAARTGVPICPSCSLRLSHGGHAVSPGGTAIAWCVECAERETRRSA